MHKHVSNMMMYLQSQADVYSSSAIARWEKSTSTSVVCRASKFMNTMLSPTLPTSNS
eukprot:m.240617 g.240617  ORF g.240617 m.240617 type:complete len:57 (+) comp15549_c1_seq1:256-426(+)